jgi:hypothetical protein
MCPCAQQRAVSLVGMHGTRWAVVWITDPLTDRHRVSPADLALNFENTP